MYTLLILPGHRWKEEPPMIIKIITGVMLLVLLSGCASTPQPAPIFIPAKKTEFPLQITTSPDKMNYHFTYGADPALEHAFEHYLKSGKAPNIVRKGFVNFAYVADQQPVISTIPLQETVLSLEPGEKFENISTGDPSRWSYSVATSGQGSHLQQNILIKPSAPGISTNMVITTNKRIYNVRLVSGANPDSKSMRSVRFWYPKEIQTEVSNPVSQPGESIALNHLNFNYHLKNETGFSLPSWAPTRIFDDGNHTYIQFPRTIASTDMPILFVLGDHKTNELVNYRYQAPYFIVDKLFKQAVLVLGTGRNQVRLMISHDQ